METDLIDQISEEEGITNAIILTHNIDFVFLENVLLPAMARCGHPKLTVYADAICCSETYQRQKRVIEKIGTRYRVVPVLMTGKYKFHPKAILLTGPEKASLYIGSGNLGYGGWRNNAEIWKSLGDGKDVSGYFGEFKQFLNAINEGLFLSDVINKEVEGAFDPTKMQWALKLSNTENILWRNGDGEPLLEKMSKMMKDRRVERLIVCSPYFDEGGVALENMIDVFKVSKVEVLYQSGQSTLKRAAYTRLKNRARVYDVQYMRDKTSNPFIHAKFYAFFSASKVHLFLGSANCSRAALTVGGLNGNTEMMIYQEMSEGDFVGEVYQRLKVGVKSVKPEEIEDVKNENEQLVPDLKILVASMDRGSLFVGYHPETAEIKVCQVDGVVQKFGLIEPGKLRVILVGVPENVLLKGLLNGKLVESFPSWVDDEDELNKTSSERRVSDALNNQITDDGLDIDGFIKIMSVFYDERLLNAQTENDGSSTTINKDEANGRYDFTAEEILSIDESDPIFNVGVTIQRRQGNKFSILKDILLRLFGDINKKRKNDGKVETDEIDDAPDAVDKGDVEVDRPEKIEQKIVKEKKLIERQIRRVKKIIEEVADAITCKEYYRQRSLNICKDLKMVFVMLWYARKQKWIEPDTYYEATIKIWSSMFLACEENGKAGWVSIRGKEDKDSFVKKMRNDDLAATMIIWSVDAMEMSKTVDFLRFYILLAVSYSKYPWVWRGNNITSVKANIEELLALDDVESTTENKKIESFKEHWKYLNKLGYSLRSLDNAVKGFSPDQLNGMIKNKELMPGEILKQGTLGLCVAIGRNISKGKENVHVRSLLNDEEITIQLNWIVPIRGLLEDDVLKVTPEFGKAQRKIITDFINDISSKIKVEEEDEEDE